MNRVTIFCFVASYALALMLELLHLWLQRRALRILALLSAIAGLIAHTAFLYSKQPPLIWQFSWLLFVSWVLAVFYLTGALHYRRQSWGVFVLPLVLALAGMAVLFGQPSERGLWTVNETHTLWGPVHGILLLLASVGVCVGFLASVMYLVQSNRLRTKTTPSTGLQLLSLERLESMNRHAIWATFPLLTAGMLAGVILLSSSEVVGWTDPRVVSTVVLWVLFAVVLFMRLASFLKARQVAMMTIVAFFLMLCCLALSHNQPATGGG
jgi:ABC-type transport system involved in cytochrome c biogenesis permease subunit